MDELLEIIMRDKAWNNAVPRKTYVAILELLTPPKPKADPLAAGKTAGRHRIGRQVSRYAGPPGPTGGSYRRKLSMALN
jgi:putative thioredoxin